MEEANFPENDELEGEVHEDKSVEVAEAAVANSTVAVAQVPTEVQGKDEEEKRDLEEGEEEEEEEEDEEEEEEEEEEEKAKMVFKLLKKDEIKGEGESEFSYDDEEEDEDVESYAVSYASSVLSEISFIWEDEIFKFEELIDPGNIEAIFTVKPSRSDFFDQSGVDQYTAVCKSLNIVPMTRLLKSLKTDEIDLSHRNVDSKNIRALCAALEFNNLVSRLILRYNWLSPIDCTFIGYVLLYNENILLLDLTGCRIGPEGLKLLIEFLGKNLGLEELILSRCNIQDEGMKLLGFVLMRNNAIKKLDLSYNNLAEESGEALGMAFKMNTCITDLNLRYNNLFDPVATRTFYSSLANNPAVSRLDLSWNGLGGVDMGINIAKFLKKNQSIQYLDISDNRLEGLAVIEIKKAIPKAKSLEVLKMGKNPMSPEDLESLLNAVKANPNLKMLDLEDLWVKKPFLKIANKISQEREFEVNFEGVFSNYEVFGPDYAALILKRAQFEAQKPKKEKFKKDFGHFMWSLGDEPLTQNAFMDLVKKFKAKINKQLYPELLKQFTMPKTQLIDVVSMREKYLSLFPDSTPPPPKKKKPTKVDRIKQKGKGKKKKDLQSKDGGVEEVTEDENGEGFEEENEEIAEGFDIVDLNEEAPEESELKEENKQKEERDEREVEEEREE